jgi:hypothetical protein
MKEKLLIFVFFLSIFSVICETDEFSLALTQISSYLRQISREKSIPIGQRLIFALVMYRKTFEVVHGMEQALFKKQDEDKMKEEQRKVEEEKKKVKEENFKKMAKVFFLKKNKPRVFLRF